jgi:hypothetical protein
MQTEYGEVSKSRTRGSDDASRMIMMMPRNVRNRSGRVRHMLDPGIGVVAGYKDVAGKGSMAGALVDDHRSQFPFYAFENVRIWIFPRSRRMLVFHP